MRLTQYTDFSLRVLIYLGLAPDRRCRIREIAEAYDISKNHLMKVAQQLAACGFVQSTRGAGGGLTLSRPPQQINLADVVEQMEPDFGLVECMRPGNECVITPSCTLPRMLVQANTAFLDVLRNHTLADLLPPERTDAMRIELSIRDPEAESAV